MIKFIKEYCHNLFSNDGPYTVLLWIATILILVEICVTFKVFLLGRESRKQHRIMTIQEWNQKHPEYSKTTYNREETRQVLKEMIEKAAQKR